MSDYKNKLKRLLGEATIEFSGAEYNTEVTEQNIVDEIMAAAKLYDLKVISYDEGVLSVAGWRKASIESFANFLDDNDHVLEYDLSAGITNPEYAAVEIDFDNTPEDESIIYYIDALIDPDYVVFNPVYVDAEGNTSDETYVYPVDGYDEDDYEYEELDSSETPLMVAVSNIKSASQYGSLSVTVHPSDSKKFLVQMNYEELPTQEEVLADLETINTLLIDDKFELITPADYLLGSPSTTSAVYKINGDIDVLDINSGLVEHFTGSYFEYDMTLHEITRKIKINSQGKKRIKMQCSPGFKYDPSRKVCVKIAGDEKARSRISHRRMSRTKKSLGTGYKNRVLRKVKRAKRFRKLMGF